MATYDLTQNLVTLINLIPDGDMESSSWTNGNYSTTEKKYGSRSQYFTSGTTRIMTKAMTILPIVNHKYYGRHYLKTNGSVNADDCRFEWYAGDGDGLNYVFGWNRGNYTDWTMESNIITVSAVNGSSYQCRSFMVNPTGELWVDGLMIVDLTAAFGSGNEPTKDWCDTNIPFFTGVIYLNNNLPDKFDTGDILNATYSGKGILITLPKGRYILECWGAAGGRGGDGSGNSQTKANSQGYGGYSVGTLSLTKKTSLFLYSGGEGETVTGKRENGYAGGFNGGGNGGNLTSTSSGTNGSGGGGASDIRIGDNCLSSRVIVAGGGGGASWRSNGTAHYGGHGGGATGGNAVNESGSTTVATGGTQTAGGTGGYYSSYTHGEDGSFGKGGNGIANSSTTINSGAGGGGGWYGGGAGGAINSGNQAHAGGGSGYIHAGTNSASTLSSQYILVDASTVAGNSSFASPTGTSETGHSGNGYVRITVLFEPPTIKNIYNFEYTGAVQSMTLKKGMYKLECWGAQGGSYSSYYGGAGGYSYGILNLPTTTTVYIQVGGQPATNSTQQSMSAGGYNGGGQGAVRYYSSTYSYGQGGGGGTDIRIGQDSLYARVIVAGGGGGSSSVNALTTKYGGGTSGGSPTSGYAATQTNGGTSGTVGTFGVGANTLSSKLNYKYGSGGGGGGWYGGAAAAVADDNTTSYRGYNGGGSGYVYTASTASNYPSGCLLNSNYYLTNADTIAGNASFTNPDGSTVTGHTGNGYARITEYKVNNIDFRIKVNGDWVEVASAFIKVSGEWKEIVSAHTKINGAWTE